jgi:hypothetical protein
VIVLDCRQRACCLATLVLVLAAGCGGGIKKYRLSGQVTYGDKPISVGTIVLEPTTGASTETVAYVPIRDGRYEAQVVGGPHRVSIRDMSSESGQPGSKSLFIYEYATEIDLPQESSQPVVRDIKIPISHR